MKLSLGVSALSLVATVTAGPASCINKAGALQLVTRFAGILTHQGSDLGDALATANAILDPSYSETSDSVESLINSPDLPLGTVPTEAGRSTIVTGLLNAPPVGDITTLQVYPVDCNKVLWYWLFTGIGTGEQEVKGFNLFHLNSESLICESFIEFNSIAWGTDTHQLPPQCYA